MSIVVLFVFSVQFFIVAFDCQLLQGDELRDLIQGFLAQIESRELVPDSRIDFHPDSGRSEFAWLKALRYCPRGLIELVNSKACRGIQQNAFLISYY